jgi:superfamily II DNA or RNA helicase
MIDDPSKSNRQEVAIYKWRNAEGRGTLNLVPGFGKTRCAVLVCERILLRNPNAKILAVAPNDIGYQNLVENLPKEVIVTTRYKLSNDLDAYKSVTFDLIVVDEIHRFVKDIYILTVNAKWKLGLTGDPLRGDAKTILRIHGFPVVDTITEDEALRNGWIADFVEYNLAVDIEEHKKEPYKAYSDKIKGFMDMYRDLYKRLNTVLNMKLFNSDMDLMFAIGTGVNVKTPGSRVGTHIPAEVIRSELAKTVGWSKDLDMSVDFNVRLNDMFSPGALHEASIVFGNITRERNALIINSRNKVDAVIEIINRNPVPTIIFSESTQMASDIARVLGDEAIEYHSKVESGYIINPKTKDYYRAKNGNPIKFGSTRLKKLAIEEIMNGTFKYLCTVKSLNDSVDIPILRQVITTGGTANPSTHIQRIARGKRIFADDLSKITTIINVYIKDFIVDNVLIASRDASKLRQRQAEDSAIWVDSIDEIFYHKD